MAEGWDICESAKQSNPANEDTIFEQYVIGVVDDEDYDLDVSSWHAVVCAAHFCYEAANIRSWTFVPIASGL